MITIPRRRYALSEGRVRSIKEARQVFILVPLLLFCMGMAIGGQGTMADSEWHSDRFKLYNSCKPFPSVVVFQVEKGSEINLTEDRLRDVVEIKLRRLGLYSTLVKSLKSDRNAFLSVVVHVNGFAVSIQVDFRKTVYDSVSGIKGHVATWTVDSMGMHGGSSRFIVEGVEGAVDQFLNQYLRTNECGGR